MASSTPPQAFPVHGNASPIIRIAVGGLLGVPEPNELEAIFDTGFTGFLCLPLATGISMHLNLWGIKPSVLADGSKIYNLVCIGKARFLGQEKLGEITLMPTGSDCIVGMEFVNVFGVEVLLRPGKELVFLTTPTVGIEPLPTADEAQAQESSTAATPPSQAGPA